MNIWIKPSGIEIELNDSKETVKAAKSNGWKLKEEKKQTKPKKVK